MGIVAWVFQGRGHPFNELVGRRMLQPLGLLMDLFPPVTEAFGQVGLEDSVAPEDSQSFTGTLPGELGRPGTARVPDTPIRPGV